MSIAKTNYHHGDLRSALLEAALDVINELGPRGLSIREVARRAGVSHAAPYRHFADKDQLIVAVVEQGFDLLQKTIVEKKASAKDDPVSQFSALGTAYIDFALQYPTFYRVMYSGDLLSTSGQYSLQHTSSNTFEELVNDIKTCQQLKFLRPGNPLLKALTLLSTVHGFVTLVNDNRVSVLLGENYQLEEVRAGILSEVFQGIGISTSSE